MERTAISKCCHKPDRTGTAGRGQECASLSLETHLTAPLLDASSRARVRYPAPAWETFLALAVDEG